MINAADARREVDKVIYTNTIEASVRQLEVLDGLIRKAIDKGDISIMIETSKVNDTTLEKLDELGYTVTYSSGQYGSYPEYTIKF